MLSFQHTKKPIVQLAFSPDGHTLAAVASQGTTVGRCDMPSGAYRTWPVLFGRAIRTIAYSPKGDALAVGDDSGVVGTVSVAGDTQVPGAHIHFKMPTAINALAFAPHRLKSPVLAIASTGLVLVDDARPFRQEIVVGNDDRIYSILAWSPKGDKIAAFDEFYGQVTLWTLTKSLRPNEAIIQYAAPGRCTSIAFSPDNHWLAIAHQKGVVIEDTNKRHSGPFGVLQGHDGSVTQVVFHPAGSLIATASEDETVRLWDCDTRRERECYDWKIGKVTALAFSPDGMRGAAGGAKGRIVVWDVG